MLLQVSSHQQCFRRWSCQDKSRVGRIHGDSLSIGLFKNWKIIDTPTMSENTTPLRTLEPVFFQCCKDSCSEMKNRCYLQLVSPISSLIYPRRELCFRNSNVFNLGSCARCRPDSIKLQRKYQIPILCLHFNECSRLLAPAPSSYSSCPQTTPYHHHLCSWSHGWRCVSNYLVSINPQLSLDIERLFSCCFL